MLLMGTAGIAQAGTPPEAPVPPAFVPPTPAPVVDEDSAQAFAESYTADNAGDFIGVRRHARVRVISDDARCLQSPIVETRFGCVFRLRALVIQRSRGWWGHEARSSSRRGHRGHVRHRRHFRVRQYGCLGFLRIDGGPTVTPTADVVNVECARIRRGDREVVAPTDSVADNS
jgi:hypothetical protein